MDIKFSQTDGGRVEAGIDDKNDCAVRAYSIFADVPYKDAHESFKKLGRKDAHGTPHYIIATMLKKVNAKRVYLTNKITLNQLLKQYPTGKLYCFIRGHAFTVIDGVVHDTWKVGKKVRVYEYFLHPSTEPKIDDAPIKIRTVPRGYKIRSIVKRERGIDPNISAYAIAKKVSEELGISIASANYHVRKHAKFVLA